MNNKQRKIITDAIINHRHNGFRADVAGAFNDINDFFEELLATDEKLKEMSDLALNEWMSEDDESDDY